MIQELYLKNLCKEVFFLVEDSCSETSEIEMFKDIEEVNQYIQQKLIFTGSFYPNEGLDVFHGVLSVADFIPESFNGKMAYVVCINPEDENVGFICDPGSESPEELVEQVEVLIKSGGPVSFQEEVDIDSIYILYGYPISKGTEIDPEDIDEETIEVCKSLAKKVEYLSNKQLSSGD